MLSRISEKRLITSSATTSTIIYYHCIFFITLLLTSTTTSSSYSPHQPPSFINLFTSTTTRAPSSQQQQSLSLDKTSNTPSSSSIITFFSSSHLAHRAARVLISSVSATATTRRSLSISALATGAASFGRRSPSSSTPSIGKRKALLRMSSSTAAASTSTSSSTSYLRSLENLNWDNKAIRELPVDPEKHNHIRQVRGAIYSRVDPEPVRNPIIVAISDEALTDLLDIAPEELSRPELVEYLAGNKKFPGSETYSHCYCGHQFGSFSGQLGDGAAISLGEIVNHKGERWEVQLKGAGPTPYSRRADGRKVLRSSIREFLCSEAMSYLGIPTTRAAACITSDTLTQRDIFYNGNIINERCSVVTRLAPTFLRFGSFEIFKQVDAITGRIGSSPGNEALLRQLLDYSISTYFPHLLTAHKDDIIERYKAFYREVVISTAHLVAQWQLKGFTHGVLNTDNMSILGLTIDYGPYGFMDYFDPEFIPNGSDGGGRYNYIKQPEICRWNLGKFAEALSMALPLEESLPLLDLYDEEYQQAYEGGMRAKLGLLTTDDEKDADLFEELFSTMASTAADFTQTFQALMKYKGDNIQEVADSLVSTCARPAVWAASLTKRLRISKSNMPPAQVQQLWAIAQSNPGKLGEIFGEGNVEAVKQELAGEMEKLEKAGAVANTITRYRAMSDEDKRAQDKKAWSAFLENHLSKRLKQDREQTGDDWKEETRQEMTRKVNPTFILRNWIAQDAIEAAEKKDFSRVQFVLKMLKEPYAAGEAEGEGKEEAATCDLTQRFKGPTPDWAADLVCTCSS